MPERIDIKIPELGDGIKNVKLVEWLVEEGEIVKKYNPVAVVETEKFAIEIEAPDTGVIEKKNYSEGDKVNLTDSLGYISKTDDELNLDVAKSSKDKKHEDSYKNKKSKKGLRQIFKRIINRD
ncbi:hypothetical protein GF312_22515 [Candidatus Poribacteria bacterium]|nr:hypothetical protein [Candidatus Poribacteria bacterium]